MSLPSIDLPVLNGKRTTFFRTLFGNASGLLCLATIQGDNNKGSYAERFFNYPADIDSILEYFENNKEANVYFCPQLFREPRRKKECVEVTPNVWADLDHCDPNEMLIEPTIVLESSPGRFQAFWVLDAIYDPDDVEDTAKRIAYRHADHGADKSGWDLTQLLRVPYTSNYKYPGAPQVKPIAAKRVQYSLLDFDGLYPSVGEYYRIELPKPDFDENVSAVELLTNAGNRINPLIWTLFNTTPDENTWSEKLWQLMLLLFENNFGIEQVYIIAQQSACNKYARDGRPAHQLWKDVCRADMRVQMQERIAFGKSGKEATDHYDLMTEEERERVREAGDTFIERYINWASSLGDAAVQYHQAGAFIALSCILCGSIRLPTSFGVIVPNLWFMILADTTLTRKSTAMDICTDLLEEVDEDIIMATDGSIEGLMTSLAARSNRPSLFLRDEFSGLIEAMQRKDYMAGMPELLTKLYDGKMQKRILRRETIEVRSPRLVIFGGGIRNATTAAMGPEMIQSGFIPRFVFITAESDITKVKPVGPPTFENVEERDKIGSELLQLYHFYNGVEEMMIPSTDTVISRPKQFDVELTPEAWFRYNQLETELTTYGINSSRPDIYTPVGDRLAKSILKAAVLLSTAKEMRQNVVVEEIDILRAIFYGEKWFMHTRAIVDAVGMGGSERRLQAMVKTIQNRGPNGISRSELMRQYQMSSREYALAMDTLEQRGHIQRNKIGRGEGIVAMQDVTVMIT